MREIVSRWQSIFSISQDILRFWEAEGIQRADRQAGKSTFTTMGAMEAPPNDRQAVEAAVASLQERLADGDPTDAGLRSHCEAVLTALRASYRANPAAFSREAIEALREFSELLRESAGS